VEALTEEKEPLGTSRSFNKLGEENENQKGEMLAYRGMTQP